MPDVSYIMQKKNWLVLVEAVTSHGPVNPKTKAGIEDVVFRINGRSCFCDRVP
jgi:hypothetical protein